MALGSSGIRDRGSESPISESSIKASSRDVNIADIVSEDDDDNDDDISSDIDRKSEDKANNNKDLAAKAAINTSLAGSLNIPGLANLASLSEAASAAAAASAGENDRSSSVPGNGPGSQQLVYHLMGNLQALLKMTMENSRKEEKNKGSLLDILYQST